jgi:hypothetical protein
VFRFLHCRNRSEFANRRCTLRSQSVSVLALLQEQHLAASPDDYCHHGRENQRAFQPLGYQEIHGRTSYCLSRPTNQSVPVTKIRPAPRHKDRISFCHRIIDPLHSASLNTDNARTPCQHATSAGSACQITRLCPCGPLNNALNSSACRQSIRIDTTDRCVAID